MTELTITPKIAKKCASIVGRIASGEHVSVTVVGAASLKTPTLQMRVIAGPTVIAMFPVPVEDGQTPDEWTVSGNDLVCELNLNTVQALALCRAPETYCLFSFEEVGDKNASPSERCPQLYFVAPHPVLCWPKKRPSDTPFDFDDYPSTFKTWQWQISNIAASVTKDGRTATILIVDKNGVQTVATVSDGVGVPAGGARGQVLVKKSADDFDTEWKDGGGGGGSVDWNNVENKPTAFPPEAHSQGWSTITSKPSSFTPSTHASTHAADGSDPITPASIGALDFDGTAERAEELDNQTRGSKILFNEDARRWEVYRYGEGHSDHNTLAYKDEIPALATPSTASTAQGKAADAKATGEALAGKADKSTTYTKTEVDAALDRKVDKENGKGIVTLSTDNPDRAAYADIAEMLGAFYGGKFYQIVFEPDSGRFVYINTDDEYGVLAFTSDLPYTKTTASASKRKVLVLTAATAPSPVALPAIPATDEVLNCDIVVNGKAATADFGLTLVGGTGVDVHYPNGEGITCKSGCVTMVSCVGINGLGWLVVGCNNLKTA